MSAEDTDLKKQFALELLKNPNDAYKAATIVANGDFGKSTIIFSTWQRDPVVLEELTRLREEVDEMDLLPGKAELLRNIWDRMQACLDPDSYSKLAKLYAETRAYIEKPGTNVAVNIEQPRVMLVKDHGTDEEWKAKVAEQQRRLTDANATRH